MAGAGLALSGTCPSTIFAQLGAKRPEALYALLGALSGTALYVYSYPKLWEERLSRDNRGEPQLHDTLGVRYTTAAYALSALTFVRA